MAECHSTTTPVDIHAKLSATAGAPVADPSAYRSLAGALQYTLTRPDLAFAVQQAACPDSRRSTSGYCVYLSDNLISWSSKRQTTVSHSSVEAEYCAIAHVVAECCWLPQLLQELHVSIASATVVYCDNVSAVYMTTNPVQSSHEAH
ncbi:uncharacterized mitochondrial protein AtMg00810-like [Miscanthus floridulus]|uniref:uncharacterized mitochondrial protein AtMg00810-like n=1 Tax=Miscanthus floridulus TaxID=154761 RepID=UPI00345AC5E6